jgi:molybdopterin/thiamine biosynthesis adenylyltransferase
MKDEELLRYSRHILLPEIDAAGQQALIDAHVMIIGMGGLGCPIALYLAASGVGHITISDDDTVELTNLQRQIAHHQSDIGHPKVESAKEKMTSINPHIKMTALNERLSEEQLRDQLHDVSLVIDATDSFASRVIINRACVDASIPAVFGAAVRLDGQLFIYDPRQKNAPCYECLFQNISDSALNCAESGVAAPIVGIIGTMQAMEALRLICAIGDSSAGYLQNFDARTMIWNRFKVNKRDDCSGCAKRPAHP